jgi:hypothetical protein
MWFKGNLWKTVFWLWFIDFPDSIKSHSNSGKINGKIAIYFIQPSLNNQVTNFHKFPGRIIYSPIIHAVNFPKHLKYNKYPKNFQFFLVSCSWKWWIIEARENFLLFLFDIFSEGFLGKLYWVLTVSRKPQNTR